MEYKEFVEKLLNRAKRLGILIDVLCPKCESSNNISDWHKQKIRRDGIWYYCEKCGWLDIFSFEVIEEEAIRSENEKVLR